MKNLVNKYIWRLFIRIDLMVKIGFGFNIAYCTALEEFYIHINLLCFDIEFGIDFGEINSTPIM